MPEVIIIGNSGAAKECFWLFDDMLKAAPGLRRYYNFKGFLSWKEYKGNLGKLDSWFICDAHSYEIQHSDMFVIGIGDPHIRREVYEYFTSHEANFLTLIHPWSDISADAEIGEANIFQRGSTIFCDTVIGNANYFNGSVNLSHDVVVGDYNFIGPASLILGNCHVGSENMIGVHCTLLPKAHVGNGNILAPGSILYKGCGNNCRMAGNPALRIGDADSLT